MTSHRPGSAVVPCAGAIVLDEAGRVLLVRRAHDPDRGRWSVPGGRCETGEPPEAACRREVLEECGLIVRVEREAGTVERPGLGQGRVYRITDFVCSVVGGELTPGDDAGEARWVGPDEISWLELTPGLVETLAEWQVIPWLGSDTGRPPG